MVLAGDKKIEAPEKLPLLINMQAERLSLLFNVFLDRVCVALDDIASVIK